MDDIVTLGANTPTSAASVQASNEAAIAEAFDEALARGAIGVGAMLLSDNVAEIQKEPPQS